MNDWKLDRQRYGPRAWVLQPSYWAVLVYRFGRWSTYGPRFMRKPAHLIYFGAYSITRLVTGIDLPRSARIGPGLMIHHFGGVIINPRASIGDRCTLRHGVTIGDRHGGVDVPVIGDDVNIGAYAQILGGIKIGDGASIGAMTVVLNDVPAGATAVGNPARILLPAAQSLGKESSE